MQRYLHIYRSNPFFRHNLVFFLGSVSVGALNYLYYPVIGRLMSPSAFGEVQTLISLFLQLTILLSVLSLVAVNLIVNNQGKHTTQIITELQLAALWLSGGMLLLTIVFAPMLQSALQFSSIWPFILLSVALVSAVPFTFQTAYLRGRQRFAATSIANLLVAAGKIAFSVAFVLAGWGTSGAIGGLIAAQIIGLFYALTMNTRISAVARKLRARWWPDMKIVFGQIKHVGYAFVGSLSVMLLLSLDVILVKYFFDAHTAGLYAGVATVARIIFFLTASIAQVLLPSVKWDAPAHANRTLLVKSALILSGLSLPVLLVCAIAPALIMNILMGAQYLEFSDLLAPLALAIFFVSVLNLLVLYGLALRQYVPIIFAAVGTVMTYAVMLIKHDSLNDIVSILLLGSVVTTGFVAGWFVVVKKKELASAS